MGALSVKLLNDLMGGSISAGTTATTAHDLRQSGRYRRIWDAVQCAVRPTRQARLTSARSGFGLTDSRLRLARSTSLCIRSSRTVSCRVKLDDDEAQSGGPNIEPWKTGCGRSPARAEETNARCRISYYWLGTLTIGDERLHGKMTGISVSSGDYSGLTGPLIDERRAVVTRPQSPRSFMTATVAKTTGLYDRMVENLTRYLNEARRRA